MHASNRLNEPHARGKVDDLRTYASDTRNAPLVGSAVRRAVVFKPSEPRTRAGTSKWYPSSQSASSQRAASSRARQARQRSKQGSAPTAGSGSQSPSRRLRETTKGRFPRQRVVLDEGGETPTRQWMLYKFKCHLWRTGVKEWSFHSLRHFFVTQLMRGGTSAEVVRVRAGHSKLEMT